jgi:hypothetical protein
MTAVCVPKQLSNWELGDLLQIDPSRVVRDAQDQVGRLILRLALAFNDLKGMIMLDQYRLAFTPSKPEDVTPQSGQVGGLAVQVHRYIGGILNEALKVVHEEHVAMSSSEITNLLSSLPKQTRELWRDIVAEATSSPAATNQTNRAMLACLRNKSSFHYDGDRLRAAFDQYFGNSAKTARNTISYYSSGTDMDSTRYYFADAAAQTDYVNAGAERGQKTDAEVAKFAQNVNEAFALLINAFLKARSAAP